MDRIIWLPRAQQQLEQRLVYARLEFGKATANRWVRSIEHMEHRLLLMPESYSPEPLLKDCIPLFRACIIMKRFKVIYFYMPEIHTIYIADIWDSRMAPEALRQRLI